MAWVRYDDGFPKHPKVRKAAALVGGRYGRARVIAVHMEATSYCNSHSTDGFIDDVAVKEELTSDPQARDILRTFALPSIRLAKRVRGGWQLHDYLEYQPSKEEMEESRRYERDRKRKLRARPESVPSGQNGDTRNVPDVSRHPARPSGPTDRSQDQDHRAAARTAHAVLVKLAHQALTEAPEDSKNHLKDLAARARIHYDGIAVTMALDAAEHQRQKLARAVES